jgi:hypothetical protein
MRKKVVLAAIIVLASWGVASAELQNSSFEDPVTGQDNTSDMAAHWGRWGQWMNRETGWTPTHSGDCLMGYHHWEIETPDTSGVFQDVSDVPADTEVTFVIQVMRDGGTNIRDVELRLEPLNGGNTIASRHFSTQDLPSGDWTAVSVSGNTVGAGGVRVLVIITPGSSHERQGAIKLDDAELQF